MSAVAMRTLRNRAERMLKIIDLPKPPAVLIAREAVMILQAACMYAPTETGQHLGEEIGAAALGEVGLCSVCDGEMAHETHTCGNCLEEFADDEGGGGEGVVA